MTNKNKNVNERRSMLLSEKLTELEHENEQLKIKNAALEKTISTYEREFTNIAKLIGQYEELIKQAKAIKEDYRELISEAKFTMSGYKKNARDLIERMKKSV